MALHEDIRTVSQLRVELDSITHMLNGGRAREPAERRGAQLAEIAEIRAAIAHIRRERNALDRVNAPGEAITYDITYDFLRMHCALLGN